MIDTEEKYGFINNPSMYEITELIYKFISENGYENYFV